MNLSSRLGPHLRLEARHRLFARSRSTTCSGRSTSVTWVSPGKASGNWLVGGEHPLEVAQGYGTTLLLTSLGTAVGLAAHGYADMSEIGRGLAETYVENTAALGKVAIPEDINAESIAATMLRETTGIDAHPEDLQLMGSELMPFGQLFDRVNKAAYKYGSLTDFATRVGFPIKADYSADSYESREARKVGSHLADMERELNLAKDTDKRGGFKRESGHFGQEGKQIYEAHPEYLAIKSAQSDVARRVSQISDLQAKGRSATTTGLVISIGKYRRSVVGSHAPRMRTT